MPSAVLSGEPDQEAVGIGLGTEAEFDGVDRDTLGAAADLGQLPGPELRFVGVGQGKITSGRKLMARISACSWSVPSSATIEPMNFAARLLFRWVAKKS